MRAEREHLFASEKKKRMVERTGTVHLSKNIFLVDFDFGFQLGEIDRLFVRLNLKFENFEAKKWMTDLRHRRRVNG